MQQFMQTFMFAPTGLLDQLDSDENAFAQENSEDEDDEENHRSDDSWTRHDTVLA